MILLPGGTGAGVDVSTTVGDGVDVDKGASAIVGEGNDVTARVDGATGCAAEQPAARRKTNNMIIRWCIK